MFALKNLSKFAAALSNSVKLCPTLCVIHCVLYCVLNCVSYNVCQTMGPILCVIQCVLYCVSNNVSYTVCHTMCPILCPTLTTTKTCLGHLQNVQHVLLFQKLLPGHLPSACCSADDTQSAACARCMLYIPIQII